MKKFENSKMVLFDSTNASFRLAVETQFVRGNPEQGFRNLVYVSNKYNAILNPNIYLTFTYKNVDKPAPIYTSYPQLYKIREAMEKVKNLLVDNKGFILAKDNKLVVNSTYAEPVIINNIGKNNNWIKFALVVMETGDNGVTTTIPGVSIELSTTEKNLSVLTTDEFLTIYTIVHDLNLSTIQCMQALAYLDSEDEPNQPKPQYNNTYAYGDNNSGYTPKPRYNNYPNNGNSGYTPKPRYNNYPNNGNSGYTPRAPYSSSYSRTPAQSQAASSTNLVSPSDEEDDEGAPAISISRQNNASHLPPRSTTSAPVINLKAVNDTPESTIDYNDSEEVDKIFENAPSDNSNGTK